MRKTLVLVLTVLLFTVFTYSGIEWTTTMKSSGKGKRASNDIATRTSAQGGNVKQVFEGVANENMMQFQDGYWLFRSDDENIYIVNDAKQNYMTISIDGLLQVTGMLGSLVKITIKDHSINVEELPSEKILGYDCKHIKITTEYTMKIKIAIIKQTMKVYEVKEIWGSNAVPGIKEVHKGFMKKNFKTGIPDLDEMLQEQMEKQKNIGFPLKMVTHTVNKGKKGKVKGETKMTMTVTKIQNKKFNDAFFQIPEGYEHVPGPWEKKGKMGGIF